MTLTAEIAEEFKPYPTVSAQHINRNVYCQYCKHMRDDHKLLGRDSAGRVAFKCNCGGIIRLYWAREVHGANEGGLG